MHPKKAKETVCKLKNLEWLVAVA